MLSGPLILSPDLMLSDRHDSRLAVACIRKLATAEGVTSKGCPMMFGMYIHLHAPERRCESASPFVLPAIEWLKQLSMQPGSTPPHQSQRKLISGMPKACSKRVGSHCSEHCAVLIGSIQPNSSRCTYERRKISGEAQCRIPSPFAGRAECLETFCDKVFI